MVGQITEKTIRQFVANVSDQHFSAAGAVIAASAAQAAALAEACLQISLDNQVDTLDWQAVSAQIEQMANIKTLLLEWCDRDANAMIDYVTLSKSGLQPPDRQILFESPAEIGRLCINAATLLQDFRPLVFEQVQDDLEMALLLLFAAGRAAMLLLDSNLRLWPEPAMLDTYDPLVSGLDARLKQLNPVSRIRTPKEME